MAEDFSIKQIEMELSRLRGLQQPEGLQSTQTPEGKDFGAVLKDAINEVNELQKTSQDGIESQMVAGEGTELHKTMIQLQEADVSFQTMMQVRNKILKAYEELIRMPM